LIVNLTKHIHLKQDVDQFDEDFITNNFPSFYWVLRDFTLKLENEQGLTLTEDQYLERALRDSEGYSDAIVQKN